MKHKLPREIQILGNPKIKKHLNKLLIYHFFYSIKELLILNLHHYTLLA